MGVYGAGDRDRTGDITAWEAGYTLYFQNPAFSETH